MGACTPFVETQNSKKEKVEIFRPLSGLSLQVPECHFIHIWLVKAVLGSAQISVGRHGSSCWWKEEHDVHTGGRGNWCWPFWKPTATLSFIRISGPRKPQPCLSCSPLHPQHLLLCLAHGFCENIYCKGNGYTVQRKSVFVWDHFFWPEHFLLSPLLTNSLSFSKLSLCAVSFMTPGRVILSSWIPWSIAHVSLLCWAFLGFLLGGPQRAKIISSSYIWVISCQCSR